MRKTTFTDPAALGASAKPRRTQQILSAAAAAVALLIVGPLLAPQADAALLANGGFCIKGTYIDGGQTAIHGAPGCSGIEEAAPAPVPSIPMPDLAVAGVCAAPNADRKVFALTRAGVILEHTLQDSGALSAGTEVSRVGFAAGAWPGPNNANSLGLTPRGDFHFTTAGGALYTHSPERGTAQIAPSSLAVNPIAGASMVYKGQTEYYAGAFALVAGGAELTVYRHSPQAERTGLVFKTLVEGAKSASGDFAFAPNGDLRVFAGNRFATIPFAQFADLGAGTGAQLDSVQANSELVGQQVGSFDATGVAFLGDVMVMANPGPERQLKAYRTVDNRLVRIGTDPRLGTPYADYVVDLASCQIS